MKWGLRACGGRGDSPEDGLVCTAGKNIRTHPLCPECVNLCCVRRGSGVSPLGGVVGGERSAGSHLVFMCREEGGLSHIIEVSDTSGRNIDLRSSGKKSSYRDARAFHSGKQDEAWEGHLDAHVWYYYT